MTALTWKIHFAPELYLEALFLQEEFRSLDEISQNLPAGAYTTFRTFGRNRVLRLEDHFARLEETAALANHPLRLDRQAVCAALRKGIAAHPAHEMRMRLTFDLTQHPGDLYLSIEKLKLLPPSVYQMGVKAITRRMHRDNPKAKLTQFIHTAGAIRQSLPEGVNEALMLDDRNCFLEGLSSNFFAVLAGEVWTAEEGVLSGITRATVLQATRDAAIPVRLTGLPFARLAGVQEAFITSASRAVLPVVQIDDLQIGTGQPGPITTDLQQRYTQLIEKNLDVI